MYSVVKPQLFLNLLVKSGIFTASEVYWTSSYSNVPNYLICMRSHRCWASELHKGLVPHGLPSVTWDKEEMRANGPVRQQCQAPPSCLWAPFVILSKHLKLFHQDLPDLIINCTEVGTLCHFHLRWLPGERSPGLFELAAWLHGGCGLQPTCCQPCREKASHLLPAAPIGTKKPISWKKKKPMHQKREQDSSGVILSRIFLVYAIMSQIVNQPLLTLGKLQVSAHLTIPGADKPSRWVLTICVSCGRETLQLQEQFSVARSQQGRL